jgi:DNA-binding Lrp family transcriptional regulator
MKKSLDRIDYQILDILQRNASIPAPQIGRALGVTATPCLRRIGWMKEAGYIARIVALLDRRMLNLNALFFVKISLMENNPAAVHAFASEIRGIPEVLDCHFVVGGFDVLLRVVTQDETAFERFRSERLNRISAVRQIECFSSLLQTKQSTALPLAGPIAKPAEAKDLPTQVAYSATRTERPPF